MANLHVYIDVHGCPCFVFAPKYMVCFSACMRVCSVFFKFVLCVWFRRFLHG